MTSTSPALTRTLDQAAGSPLEHPVWQSLTLATALCTGLGAGIFAAFSIFVMNGLDRLPPAAGIAAMNAINVAAVRPGLMIVLFTPVAAFVPLTVLALRHRGTAWSALLLVAAVLYLVGVVGLTGAYHVPHNDALALVDPSSPAAPARWADYVTNWTRWNHVRAAAALGSSGALTLALLRR